ncbi:MAG TPA: hypothetical protein VIV63_10540 [Steroidobacteraceae bacterium]
MTFELSALHKHMPIIDGFPRPQWAAIDSLISQQPEAESHTQWVAAARAWMEATARHLGSPYAVAETDHFFLLSPLSARQTGLLRVFIEKAWKQIGVKLEGLGETGVLGKCVVMLFDSHDRYYEYSAHFYGEGEHPISTGVFLNAEYGHTAIPFFDIAETEATLAHELTHCFLRSLPIPLWLNEGLAVTMEDEMCANRPLRMDSQRLAEHADYWTAETIQDFWSGQSFQRVDEGIDLSYELARYCVRALAHDVPMFIEFAKSASFEDGGEAAATKVYGGSLGGVIHQFFGPGDWSPRVR